MRIICRECQNTKYFILRREVEIEFDYKKGIWDEEGHQNTYGGTIVCKECGADSTSDDIDVNYKK